MTEELSKLGAITMLKSIDIAEAIIYALSAPQRVNVRRKSFLYNICKMQNAYYNHWQKSCGGEG